MRPSTPPEIQNKLQGSDKGNARTQPERGPFMALSKGSRRTGASHNRQEIEEPVPTIKISPPGRMIERIAKHVMFAREGSVSDMIVGWFEHYPYFFPPPLPLEGAGCAP